MLSNVRFLGFVDEELRDEVNVAGRDAIRIDCECTVEILKMLMSLGAEIRFADNRNMQHVIDHFGIITLYKIYTSLKGESYFDVVTQGDVSKSNVTIIADYDRSTITGFSGNYKTLLNILDNMRDIDPHVFRIYLENVPVIFSTGSMEKAILAQAGVFGLKSESPIVVPVEYNGDPKTLGDIPPSVKFCVGWDGYIRILDAANPDYTIRCRMSDDGSISVLGLESDFADAEKVLNQEAYNDICGKKEE